MFELKVHGQPKFRTLTSTEIKAKRFFFFSFISFKKRFNCRNGHRVMCMNDMINMKIQANLLFTHHVTFYTLSTGDIFSFSFFFCVRLHLFVRNDILSVSVLLLNSTICMVVCDWIQKLNVLKKLCAHCLKATSGMKNEENQEEKHWFSAQLMCVRS